MERMCVPSSMPASVAGECCLANDRLKWGLNVCFMLYLWFWSVYRSLHIAVAAGALTCRNHTENHLVATYPLQGKHDEGIRYQCDSQC
jgi:hypothetical protein